MAFQNGWQRASGSRLSLPRLYRCRYGCGAAEDRVCAANDQRLICALWQMQDSRCRRRGDNREQLQNEATHPLVNII